MAKRTHRFTLMNYIKKHKALALALIVALGFVLRARELGKAGLNEDEAKKAEAARAYLHGNFFVNLEHPMLMKSLDALALATFGTWDRIAGPRYHISVAAAVRLPNAIFGSLTAIVIFLFAEQFFGFEVGLFGAFLWAIGTIAIMVNREAKEDTLLVFFTWLGYYLYLRAKKLSAEHPTRAGRLYAASGGSFGLMLASKYFPHYLGLNFLYYWLLPGHKKKFPRLGWREALLLFGTFAAAFLLVNPVVLFPRTFHYVYHYAHLRNSMTHYGYLMMGHLRYDDPGHLHGGMPIYFYPLFLVIMTPLPVLVAFAIGLIEVVRRWREPGPFFLILMFLSWIIPFSLISAKWFYWILSWMPLVYIIAALGMRRVLGWIAALRRRFVRRRLVPVAASVLGVAFFGVPAWAAVQAAPFYTLYLNPLGFGRTAYYFPHDELNDMGVRQALRRICQEAPHGATVGGESEPLFEYYFKKFDREDLHYAEVSNHMLDSANDLPSYAVVQPGREYFGNISFIHRLQARERPVWTVTVHGVSAVTVYHSEEIATLGGQR
jgi:hypothetical protein